MGLNEVSVFHHSKRNSCTVKKSLKTEETVIVSYTSNEISSRGKKVTQKFKHTKINGQVTAINTSLKKTQKSKYMKNVQHP